MTWTLHHADALDALRAMPDNSAHGCLCDPPYGISFMSGRIDWDGSLPSIDIWRELLRVLRPGSHALIFGGTRTWHRLAVSIEDAGFEIRDTCMYLYGKGFPKSLNISKAIDRDAGAERPVIGERTLTGNAALSTKEKGGTYGVQVGSVPSKVVPVTGPATDAARQWDGYGTALKPAWEPCLLVRKPLDGTVAANALKWGTGGLAIDASRIGRANDDVSGWSVTGSSSGENVAMSGANYARAAKPDASGRFPANLLLDEEAAAALDAEAGERKSAPAVLRNGGGGKVFGSGHGYSDTDGGYSDSGGASRFFFTAKVSTAEREAGCEYLPHKSAAEVTGSQEGAARLDSPRTGAGRTGGARNHHPTLKPISLTKYLARLILPPTPDAVLLVPFAGTGSEMIGGLLAGWPTVIGIEREAEYVEIARARIPRQLDVTEYVQPNLFGETA